MWVFSPYPCVPIYSFRERLSTKKNLSFPMFIIHIHCKSSNWEARTFRLQGAEKDLYQPETHVSMASLGGVELESAFLAAAAVLFLDESGERDQLRLPQQRNICAERRVLPGHGEAQQVLSSAWSWRSSTGDILSSAWSWRSSTGEILSST